ncbi:MAG: hypothetical protein V1792_03865 [Pseudomonadota bacterium]
METIKVSFMHPTDGRLLSANIDGTMTAGDAIEELIGNDFIARNPQGYNLAIKGGAQLNADQSFVEAGVQEGAVLRIIPATDAGIPFRA